MYSSWFWELTCDAAQEGICMTLQPEFKFLEVAFPYVAKRLLTDDDPGLRTRLVQVRVLYRTRDKLMLILHKRHG